MPGAIGRSLGVIVGRVAGAGESARLEASSSHTVIWGAHAGASSYQSSSEHVPQKEAPPSAMPNLPEAQDLCDHSGHGA